MGVFTWLVGDSSDDWTDPAAWSGGIVPGPDDIASFAGATATVFGDATVGTIALDDSQVTLLDGFFQAETTSPSLIDQSTILNDSGAAPANTLAVDSTAFLDCGLMSLGDTDLSDQGGLLATGGDVQRLEVSGFEGFAAFAGTLSTTALTVTDGASVTGDILLTNQGELTFDELSSLSQGTIETQGQVILNLVPSQVSSGSTMTLGDGLMLDANSDLTVLAASNCTLSVEGAIVGAGTLQLGDTPLVLAAGASIDSAVIETGLGNVGGIGGSNGGAGSPGTITVMAGSTFDVSVLLLAEGTILDSGSLETSGGTLQSLSVSGSSATASVSGTLDISTLTISTGGTFTGNVLLSGGSVLSLDNSAILSDGTIDVSGSASVSVLPPAKGSATATLQDSVYLDGNSTLTADGPAGSSLELAGSVEGSGTLFVEGTTITLIGGASVSVVVLASSGRLILSALIDSAALSEPSDAVAVSCISGNDEIDADSLPVSITGAGAQTITFDGGSGSAYLNPGTATLMAALGSGPTTIVGGSSGHDAISCGQGSTVIYGIQGMSVSMLGSAPTTICAGAGNGTFDASGSSGNNVYYTGYVEGAYSSDSITGGSGSDRIYSGGGRLYVQCGSGAEAVWGGDSADTIVGGTGNDTLAGGANADISVQGPGHDIVFASGDGGNYNFTAGTGETDFYAGNGTVQTKVIAGAGADFIIGRTAPLLIVGGSGNLTLFPYVGEDVKVGLSGGQNLLTANEGSHVSVSGGGSNVLVSYPAGNNLFDCSASNGSNTIFGGSSGVNTIYGGSGNNTIAGGFAPLSVVGGCGNQYVWDDSNGNSTIIGSSGNNTVVAFSHTIAELSSDGTNEFYAAGSNTTLIGGAGTNVFNILNNVTNTDCTIYGGTNTVIGNSGLLNLSVSSGDVTLDSGSGNEIITISPNALGGELNIYSYSPSECTLESLGSTESILVPNASSWTYGVQTIKDGGFTITLHK